MSKRFVQKTRWIALALASGLTWSGLAGAAALGEINVLSARGEPLKAEIDLILASDAERNGMSVSLTSPEQYWNSTGSSPVSGMSGLSARIQTRSEGGAPYVLVTSSDPIQQEVLSLVAELGSDSGKSVRQYVFRFTSAVAPEAAPPVSAGQAVDKSAAESTLLVKRGDYLNKIATENKPVDVSLERMLVALYRANPTAFSGKNMNRLRAGKVLRMPTEAELAGVTQRDARREIHAHVADWNAYRQQIAQHSTGYDTGYSQEGSGRIGSSVSAEEAGDRLESNRDVLKLSKGDAPGSRESAAEIRSLKDKLQAAEEEVTARDKALRESRERIAMLEKNNQEMQRLLELKSEAAVPEQPQAASAPVETAVSAPVVVPVEQKTPAVAPEKHEAPDESVKETKSSLPYYLAGAGVALLGILGTVLFLRRKPKPASKPAPSRQAKAVEEEKPEQVEPGVAPVGVVEPAEAAEPVPTPLESAEEAVTAEESAPTEIEAVPVSESVAEVEIDMGEPPVEPETLVEVMPEISGSQDAGQSEADLEAAKLAAEMEAGFAAFDRAPVEQVAAPNEPGVEVTPETMEFDVPSFVPEFSGAVTLAEESDSSSSSAAIDAASGASVEGPSEEIVHAEMMEPVEVESVAAAEAVEPAVSAGVESGVEAAPHPAVTTGDKAEVSPIELDIPTIDQYSPPVEAAPLPPMPGMADVDLNMVDDTSLTEEELQARGEQWLQVATKIDLARAYQEMGDFAGAREILEEVVGEGDSEQRAMAESLLQQLPAL